MAELLIYNAKHWMDDLTEKQIVEYEKKYPQFRRKYEARIQKGDIIAVYPDGTCKEKPSPHSKYIIAKVPDMTIEEGRALLEESRDEAGDVLKRREKRVAIETLSTTIKDQLSVDRMAIITKIQVPIDIKAKDIVRG